MQKRNEGEFNTQPKLQLEDIPSLPHMKGVSPKYNTNKEQSFQYTSNSPLNNNMEGKLKMEQEMEDDESKSFKLYAPELEKNNHNTTRNSEYTSYQDEDSLNEVKLDLKSDLIEELIDSEVKEIETGNKPCIANMSSEVDKYSSRSVIHIIDNKLKELKEMNLKNIEEIESLLDDLSKNE